MVLSSGDTPAGFDAGPLFQDVGFELFAGDRVGLVWPNRVGKTTLLRLLVWLDRLCPPLADWLIARWT